jgi:hypothetical protein
VRQTRIARRLDAPRAAVYAALVDPRSVAKWKVPAGMQAEVHEFDPREGGAIRVSLTYTHVHGRGKTSARTDTYNGRFVDGGTDLVAVHESVPPGVSLDDNAMGWVEALTRLAALVERSQTG